MILNVYTIYDSKAEEFGPVFEAKNDSVAMRKCKMEFKDVPVLDDYSLYCIGLVDHDEGAFDYLDPDVCNQKVCDLKDLFVVEESK